MSQINERSETNNPFKELNVSVEVPKNLRPRIIQSISIAKVVLDVAELFTVNYMSTLGKLFVLGDISKEEEDEKKVT